MNLSAPECGGEPAGRPTPVSLSMTRQFLKMPKPHSPRADFRQRQKQRMDGAATLGAKFLELKSLTAEAEFYAEDDADRIGGIKYVINVEHASSVVCLDCPNRECVCGDFDLTEVLTAAVVGHRTSVVGAMRCRGWRDQGAIDKIKCGVILRYRLRLGY